MYYKIAYKLNVHSKIIDWPESDFTLWLWLCKKIRLSNVLKMDERL